VSKALENKGLNGGSEKKYPLPVNGYVGPRVYKNIYWRWDHYWIL